MTFLTTEDLKAIQAPTFNQVEFLLNYSGPVGSWISGIWVDNFSTSLLRYQGKKLNGNRFDFYRPYVNIPSLGCNMQIDSKILKEKPLEEWTIGKFNLDKMRNRIGAKTI